MKGSEIMKYSCCIGLTPDRLETLKKYGYSGYETGFSGLTNAPDERIIAMKEASDALGMPCVSHNGMFPAEIDLLAGPDGYSAISEYLEKTIEKAARLGSPIVVLGSGRSRNVKNGVSIGKANEIFVNMLKDVVTPWARKHGISVAIEELQRSETNFINSCREAMEIVRAVDEPEIGLLIDYFHATMGGDKLIEMVGYGSSILHVHMASPKNARRFPNIDDVGDCRSFFAALKKAGYNGFVSLEGSDGGNFESALAEAISVMKEAEKMF